MTGTARDPSAMGAPVAQAASRWALLQEAGLSPIQARALAQWLAADPAHAAALAAAQDALGRLAQHAADPAIIALRQAALAARPDPLSWRRRPRAIAATLLLLLAVPPGLLLLGRDAQDPSGPMVTRAPAVTSHYATAVGERSTVTLPDGSVMVLNTASQAELAYSAEARTVRLLKGQALFTVAHGQKAPFRVEAGDRTITAVGTVFDVRMDGKRVQVAMLEGTVRVEPRQSAAAPMPVPEPVEILSAGEVLVAAGAGPVRVKSEDVETLTSWRAGLITFKDTPLVDAVAEINRYAVRPILLKDAAAGRHRLSGTFRVGDPQRFARLMTELFPLEMDKSKDGDTVLRHR